MKAAVQMEVGRLSIREIEKPVAGPGEIVVAVEAALTCGTDRKLLERGHAKLSPPLVMGHEFSGRVESAGEGAAFEPGDDVVCGVSGPCGTCSACISGASNRCERPERVWGAFAEFVRVPALVASENTYRRPASLSPEVAALLDPLACVVRGFSRLDPRPSGAFTIVGAGAVGLLWLAAARRAGIPRVVVVGRGAERLALAKKWGAETYSPGDPAIPRAAAVAECVGRPEAWSDAVRLALPGGRVMLFGGCAPGAAAEIDTGRVHYEEVTCLGSFHYTPAEAATALEWLSSMPVDLAELLSGEGAISDVPMFFDRMRRGQGIKYVVKP